MAETIVEYLALFPTTGSFCDSAERFIQLLGVDSKVKLDGGQLSYDCALVCSLEVVHGEVAGGEMVKCCGPEI